MGNDDKRPPAVMDRRVAEIFAENEARWMYGVMSRAVIGLQSVAVAADGAGAGGGAVAVVAPVEAAALLHGFKDAEGSARVATKPPAGKVWAVGVLGVGHIVFPLSLPLAPIDTPSR